MAGIWDSRAAMRPVSMRSHRSNWGVLTIRRNAARLFCNWERSSRDSPRAPDGWWMTRTPVSRLFWFWPPLPPERKVWTSQSWMETLRMRVRPGSVPQRVMVQAYEIRTHPGAGRTGTSGESVILIHIR